MNDKIFFVHRTKYHKSDYKFHHTDSYNHSRYLSCGLECLGHSQVAENIRCLILIFWENNFVTEKATDRWSDNFASPLFWYVLSPVWLVGVCDDWKNNFTIAQGEVFTKVFQEKMSSVDPGFLPGPLKASEHDLFLPLFLFILDMLSRLYCSREHKVMLFSAWLSPQ